MEKQIKSYSDLLEEEARIKQEIEVSQIKIEERFEIDLSIKSIFGFVQNILPFNWGAKTKSKTSDLLDTSSSDTSLHSEDRNQESYINLALDLVYESVSLLLLRKSRKEKEDSNLNRSSTSIQLLLKSMVDKFYYENRDKLSGMLSNLILKGKEKLANYKANNENDKNAE